MPRSAAAEAIQVAVLTPPLNAIRAAPPAGTVLAARHH